MVPPVFATRMRASSRALDGTSPERTKSAPASSAMEGRDNSRPVGDHGDRPPTRSTNPRIYLDFNATAPLAAAARDAMVEAMLEAGNPSSIHAEGRRARDRVERARDRVAGLLARPREHVVFTSG